MENTMENIATNQVLKRRQLRHSQGRASGFTLVELIVVIVIIGVLGAIINSVVGGSGVSAQAKAEQKFDGAMKIVNTWAAVAQFMNVSKHPLNSNLLRAAPHDALDVLIPTDPSLALSTAFATKFVEAAPVRALEQFIVLTAPTAAARGNYAIGDATNVVTINYAPTTQTMSVIITNVPGEEVRALMDLKYPAASGASNYTGAARTTSNIQYTAVSGTNTHTLTILRKI